jgi:hypothetical protein
VFPVLRLEAVVWQHVDRIVFVSQTMSMYVAPCRTASSNQPESSI